MRRLWFTLLLLWFAGSVEAQKKKSAEKPMELPKSTAETQTKETPAVDTVDNLRIFYIDYSKMNKQQTVPVSAEMLNYLTASIDSLKSNQKGSRSLLYIGDGSESKSAELKAEMLTFVENLRLASYGSKPVMNQDIAAIRSKLLQKPLVVKNRISADFYLSDTFLETLLRTDYYRVFQLFPKELSRVFGGGKTVYLTLFLDKSCTLDAAAIQKKLMYSFSEKHTPLVEVSVRKI